MGESLILHNTAHQVCLWHTQAACHDTLTWGYTPTKVTVCDFSNVWLPSPFWASQSARCVSAGAGWWLGGHRSHPTHPNTSSHPGQVSQWEAMNKNNKKKKKMQIRVSYASCSCEVNDETPLYVNGCQAYHRRRLQEVWYRHITSCVVTGRDVRQ